MKASYPQRSTVLGYLKNNVPHETYLRLSDNALNFCLLVISYVVCINETNYLKFQNYSNPIYKKIMWLLFQCVLSSRSLNTFVTLLLTS